jgi:hypothetical protein
VVGFIAVAGIAALAGCAREPSSLQGSRSLDDLEQAIVELPTRYPPVARIVAVDELRGDAVSSRQPPMNEVSDPRGL